MSNDRKKDLAKELFIDQITAEVCWPIRHQVMWPDHDLEFVKVPNDSEAIHFGLFKGEELVSIISLFQDSGDFQFRKFATLQKYQGNGFGTRLLKHVFDYVKQQEATSIWCNARLNKSSYYERFGMSKTEETYTKGGIEFVVMKKSFQ